MLYVTFAAVAALTCTIVTFAGLLRAVQRTNARERELLVNQLLHVIGHSWQTAPAAIRVEQPPLDTDEWWRRHEPTYYAAPEQDPEVLP